MYKTSLLIIISLLAVTLSGCASRYVNYPVTNQTNTEIARFINEMSFKHGIEKTYLRSLFYSAAPFATARSAISDMQRPIESFNWITYRNKMVNDLRTNQGVSYYYSNRDALLRAERLYGVPPHIIAGIIGIESNYGKIQMPYRAIDALITFSFVNKRRESYFKSELESFILLSAQQSVDPKQYRSSYAGALGIPQFMPSNIARYGIDGDNDGVIDIINNHSDAILSAANFLKQHGWLRARPAAVKVRIKKGKNVEKYVRDSACSGEYNTVKGLKSIGVIFPKISLYQSDEARLIKVPVGKNRYEYHVAFQNICVLMSYNQSFKYAMAVNYLANNILKRGGLKVVSMSGK